MKTIFTVIFLVLLSFFSASAQWKQCHSGEYGVYGECFGSLGSTLFLAARHAGVFKSTDNGDTWSPTSLSFTSATVQSFTTIGSIIFASTDNEEVFRSTDSGTTWVNVSKGLNNLYNVVLGTNGSALFAGGYKGFYRSTDNGDNWAKINVPSFTPSSFAAVGSMVFAVTDSGVYRSVDNGITWKDVNYQSKRLRLSAMKLVDTILYGGYGSLHRSKDSGTTWTIQYSDFGCTAMSSIDYHGKYVFIASYNVGLTRFFNNGTSWKTIGFPGKWVSKVFVSAEKIFAIVEGDIYVSTNDGDTWLPMSNRGLLSQYITSTLSVGKTIYGASSINGVRGVYKSMDNGSTWITISDESISELIENQGVILTSFSNRGIARSTDEGATWVNSEFPHSNTNCFAKNNTSIFTGGSRVYRSNDNGITWEEKNTGLPVNKWITSIKAIGSVIFTALSDSGVYRSIDNGDSWSRANNTHFRNNPYSIATANSWLYAVTKTGTYRSPDFGSTWDSINVPGKNFISIVSVGNSLFAGTDSGVFQSNDNGMTWSTFSEGLMNPYVRSLSVSGSTLFAGTYGSGMWKINVGSLAAEENAKQIHNIYSLYCYPNPTVGFITIDRTNLQFPENKPVHYTLSTLIGGKVMEFDNSEPKFTVSLEGISNGVYFLAAESGGNRAAVMVTVVE